MQKTHLLTLLAIPALLALTGCAGMGMTPSRSNAITLNVRDCTITVGKVPGDPRTPDTDDGRRSLSILSADIMAQNEGEESTTATPTQTISPETDLPISLTK